MAATYTNSLLLTKMATGEESGTWGTTLNTVLDNIDTAIGGYLSLTHGGHSFRARVYVGTVCIAESLPCSHVETAALQAVRRAEAAA